MEKRAKIVIGVVWVLGLLSLATGFAAEGTRIKGSHVDVSATGKCRYSRSPAMALGITAALALCIAHAIINVETGCGCCRRGPRPSLIPLGISWFTFVTAFLLFLTGAVHNNQHKEHNLKNNLIFSCYVVKPGVFASGALLSLSSVLLGLVYYRTLISAKETSTAQGNLGPPNQTGIAMGQPPPSSQDPVFVHEDTYNRRQFT